MSTMNYMFMLNIIIIMTIIVSNVFSVEYKIIILII